MLVISPAGGPISAQNALSQDNGGRLHRGRGHPQIAVDDADEAAGRSPFVHRPVDIEAGMTADERWDGENKQSVRLTFIKPIHYPPSWQLVAAL